MLLISMLYQATSLELQRLSISDQTLPIFMQEAPLDVQTKANCIIGKDYPAPIVDHKEIHKVNIGRIKQAYADQEGKHTQATTSPKALLLKSSAKKQKR